MKEAECWKDKQLLKKLILKKPKEISKELLKVRRETSAENFKEKKEKSKNLVIKQEKTLKENLETCLLRWKSLRESKKGLKMN